MSITHRNIEQDDDRIKEITDETDRLHQELSIALQRRNAGPTQPSFQIYPPPPAASNPFPPGRGRRLMDAPGTGQVDEATFRRTTFEFGPPAPPEKRK